MMRLNGVAVRVGLILAIALAQIATAAAGDTLQRIKAKGVIVVAIDPAWPPISWRNEAGGYEGFDVDVANEIARRMKVGIEFATPLFEDITAGHWKGAWDLAPSLTPTNKERPTWPFRPFIGTASTRSRFTGTYNHPRASRRQRPQNRRSEILGI